MSNREAIDRAAAMFVAFEAWKRTPRGRLAIALYPYSHRAYRWLARRDGWVWDES